MATPNIVPRAKGEGGLGTAAKGWGKAFITNTTADSATQGGKLVLAGDDGAAMQSGSRLGVIEFKGTESASASTVGARIQAITDAGWSGTENGASLQFYTTDGDASESVALTLNSDNLATFAGRVSQTGLGNSTFFGEDAGLNDDLSDNRNAAFGHEALLSNTTGINNVASGYWAMRANTTAQDNVGIGASSLLATTTGSANIGVGFETLSANQGGFGNIAIGKSANNARASNNYNVSIGTWALQGNNSCNSAVAIGARALKGNTAGQLSVAIGESAGENSSGDACVFLGYKAGYGNSVANSLYIANTDTATPLIHGNFLSSELTINGELTVDSRKIKLSGSTVGASDGDVVYFGGTTSMTIGTIYHYKSDGTWEATNANAVATCDGLLGVALGAASDTNGMLLRGMVTLDHDPGAIGDVLYLSAASNGDATATAPAGTADIVRVIGYQVNHATQGEIWFNPDSTYIELA